MATRLLLSKIDLGAMQLFSCVFINERNSDNKNHLIIFSFALVFIYDPNSQERLLIGCTYFPVGSVGINRRQSHNIDTIFTPVCE